MCGRYSSTKDPEDLVREFEVQRFDVREKLEPDYNVAPTKRVPVVLERAPEPDADDGAGSSADDTETSGSEEPERRLTTARWGLVPFWAKDIKIGNRLINARLETAHEKPAFRRAFKSRRCLLPADGYYEWYGETKGKKQPFFIRRADGRSLAMAGLYEIWRDPEKTDDDPDRFLRTVTVLTTTAEDSVGRIHDRMPLTLEPESYSIWLDPRVHDVDQVRSLLVPAAPGRLEAYPVSTAVNNVRNNGPDLVRPIEFDGLPDESGDGTSR